MDNKEVSVCNNKDINKTFIVSTLVNKCDGGASTAGLSLQRRNRNNTVAGNQETSENIKNQQCDGRQLSLQRRTRGGRGEGHPHTSTMTETRTWTSAKCVFEPNTRTASVPPLRSVSLRERGLKDVIKAVNSPVKTIEKGKGTERQQNIVSTPNGKTQFERITVKKEVFEKLSAKDQPKLLKQPGVERLKQSSTDSMTPGSANKKFPIINENRRTISITRKNTSQQAPVFNRKSKPAPCLTRASAESVNQTEALTSKELKMENSAVTVAVRVRPFSHR